ncbi:ComE operon protein 1 [Rubripirellula tenax]|uniref:ComE operon protein 1 n=1 Tax=Rubripirellula tenax TaxID=2528015 RepID=A0A5C6FEX2_9BACT|nr:helix-hairpin-helix domain-containing protein [Rubripirellula tenax]TWU59150.1 ComE operon protein 1 [Rubripirellula tenax]
MTEQSDRVESPFVKPPVQGLVVLLVFVMMLMLWVGSVRDPSSTGPGSPLTRPLLIDLNEAGTNELSLIPGVGPVLAHRIVADRDQNGNFASIEDLDRVHGVGPKTLDSLRSICVVRSSPPDDRIATSDD